MSSMGRRLKVMRKSRGMTLRELGALAGCSQTALSAMEHDKSKAPTAALVAGVAKALKVDSEYLMFGGDVDLAEDRAFLRNYTQMPPTARSVVRVVAEAINKGEQR